MIIENNTTPTIVFLLVNQDDATTPAAGKSPSVTISKNGGSFRAPNGSVTEMGNGWYKFQLTRAETDTNGPLVVRAEANGTLEWRDIHQVYTGMAAVLTEAAYDRIADHVLRRNFAAASASTNGDAKDFRSLLGSVAKDVNRVQLINTTLEIYEDDDQTLLGTQSVVVDANATHIRGLDTDE